MTDKPVGSTPEMRVCAKLGRGNTFRVTPEQPRRKYCDEHFIGAKGRGRPKSQRKGKLTPGRQKGTRPRSEPRPPRPAPPPAPMPNSIRARITGVEPECLQKMSVESKELVEITVTDDSITFKGADIRLVI